MEATVTAVFEVLNFGAIVVLVVLGLGVIAGMMGIFNFAHGEFVLLGAYTVYLFNVWGLPVSLGMLAAPVVVGAVAAVLERLVIRRFYAMPVIAMLGTYAVGLIIRESVRGLLGGLYRAVPEPLIGSFTFGAIHIAKWRLAIVVITVAVLLGSYVLLTRTGFGLQVRAALENPSLARASGISTGRIYAATFTLGGALAGLAGALVVPVFSLSADLGIRFLIQGFLAVMLGGVGSFEGSVIGAGLIGVLSAALPWAVAPVLADVLVFIIAVVLVRIWPRGLTAGRTV
ncbi:MAG: branched-chain amino acid ABC transporter permease [Candidatus Rokubacteria bacterium]|nr:branched-chain amino acid ABC transporter permease [Candidatus Rokubacteria bacterium]